MRLVSKLTLALCVAIAVVMSGYAYLQTRRESVLFDAELAKDQRLMGQALAVAVDAVWRTDGETRALSLVQAADAFERSVRVRWTWLDDPPARLSLGQRQALATGNQVILVARDEAGEQRRYTYAPVRGGERAGAIELSESVAGQRQYILTGEFETLAATLVIVVLCGGLAMVLGGWFVGRPIQRLCEQARRVGAGDLSTRLDLEQRDEIGELGREIDVMCDRLAATLEQLRHADRLKTVGQLASGVAHELGTPLNVVSARAKMIATKEVIGEETVHSARVITEQATRMTAIIRELLDFSRRRGPTLAIGDLRDVAERTATMLHTLAEKRRVALEVEVGGEPLPVRLDAAQLQQALTNLVVNALQATPHGGRVAVRVERGARLNGMRAGVGDQSAVQLVVEDNGRGIHAEALPHIFEPFFTTKDVGEGTGLGLSVAYSIVRDHGGWIDVRSEPGKGTRFAVFLPEAAA